MKKNYFFYIILFIFFNLYSENIDYKIKLYGLYTPSHEILVNNFFLPSIKDNFEIKLKFFPQECESARFMQSGWNTTMLRKVDVIIDAIKENQNKIFIFSDVDIVFFKSISNVILPLLKNYDFIIQKSPRYKVCTGFIIMRGNENNLRLWQDIKNHMLKNIKMSEEDVLNYFIKNKKINFIKWNFLPLLFFSGGFLYKKVNNKLVRNNLPENILLHHANYSPGIENKIGQLKEVLKIYEKK